MESKNETDFKELNDNDLNQIPNKEKDKNNIENMPRRSRLSKSFQKKSRNTLILSILAIIAILFLLFRYGLPLLSDASFLFGKVTSNPSYKETDSSEKENYVSIPNLDSLPKATKEKTIKITGTSLTGNSIIIFLNGKQSSETIVGNDGTFEKELVLTDGENIIKAKAIKGKLDSEFTDSVIIVYKTEGPELEINSPSDGSQIKGGNPIEVKGKSDPDTSVLVNDFQAITNSNGEWSYFLTLKDGDNEIKVISLDAAENKTEKVIHVTYSQ